MKPSSFLTIAFALFLCCMTLPAQAKSKYQGAFFALSVEDIDAAAEWYRTMLEMELVAEGERPAPNGRHAILRVDGLLIELQQRGDATNVHPQEEGIRAAHRSYGIFKTGLHVSDIDALAATLREKGAAFNHGIVHTPPDLGLRTFAIRDPEGNTVQFFGQ